MIFAGGSGDDFLTRGVKFIQGFVAIGGGLARQSADAATAVQRNIDFQADRAVMVALIQLGERLALTRGVAGDEIQGWPVASPVALDLFFGDVAAVTARMNQRVVGLGLDQPILQVARQQWWCIEVRAQGGQ
ncbi:hypothetical protein D3C76_909400 [compost metagenome]